MTGPEQIKIYCMEKTRGHRKKGVFIDAFNAPIDSEDNWTPAPITSPYTLEKQTAPGANTPGLNGWLREGDTYRYVYTLACPICAPGKTPLTREWENEAKGAVELRQETLNAIMNRLQRAGISEVSLSLLRRANLGLRSEVT